MEQLRMKMYKAGKKWVFVLLGLTIMTSLGMVRGIDSVIGYQTVKADVYRNDEIKSAPRNIADDTENIPNIKIIDQNNPLGISAIFAIFSKSASLGADVNGNIATSQLRNSDRDFGTRSNDFNNTNNDISYIQNIDNNGFLNDRAFRADNSVAIFGSSIQVKKNAVNQFEVNNKRVSTLNQDNTQQDKELNQYIDFDHYFNNLSNKSILYMNTDESEHVQKNFQDMNNQLIDISNVNKNKQVIYVDIEFSKLNGPQDITIKGLSSKKNGSSVIFNVRNIPENGQLQTKINYIYDNGIEIKSNSESHNMPNHVLWNFGNSNSTISINSGRILGSILAPNGTINANVNVDGNIVGSTVNINGENHRWDLQTPSSDT
ncbi:collagen-binding domain-containing protein, partial [Leuconostoc pseudomesenteroides]|uniref:collagen-binding domain-containing protein n=1 Tax=Leuconostoc pseudomesenteroides TaxID=33968 RepID=UPI0040367F1F